MASRCAKSATCPNGPGLSPRPRAAHRPRPGRGERRRDWTAVGTGHAFPIRPHGCSCPCVQKACRNRSSTRPASRPRPNTGHLLNRYGDAEMAVVTFVAPKRFAECRDHLGLTGPDCASLVASASPRLARCLRPRSNFPKVSNLCAPLPCSTTRPFPQVSCGRIALPPTYGVAWWFILEPCNSSSTTIATIR